MTNLVQLFTQQLENAQAYTGDYLQGKSLDETAKALHESDIMFGQKTVDEVKEFIRSRIDANTQYIGQRPFYFMDVSNQNKFTCYRVWESDVEALSKEWEPATPCFVGDSPIPRLTKKA